MFLQNRYRYNTNIPDSYNSTGKGEHFLLYDSGAEGGNQRVTIFGANVEQLSTAVVWLADGTFKQFLDCFINCM